MIYQNKNVVDFITKNEPLRKILIKWHHKQIEHET